MQLSARPMAAFALLLALHGTPCAAADVAHNYRDESFEITSRIAKGLRPAGGWLSVWRPTVRC